MNESELKNLIKEYGDTLPSFQPKPRRVPVWRWATVGATACAIGLTVWLTSPSAEARAVQAMNLALQNVDTMHARVYRTIALPSHLIGEVWTTQGVWANRAFIGSPMECSFVYDGQKQLYNDYRHRFSTVEPYAGNSTPHQTPLEYVKELADTGPMDVKPVFHKQPGPTLDGRETYFLTCTKVSGFSPAMSVRSSILIDATSSLPISLELTTVEDGRKDIHDRYEFEFDVPISKDVFEAAFPPAVDLVTAQVRRVSEWRAHPLMGNLLDAQVNREGDLFLMFVGDQAPVEVVGGDGTRYVRSDDYAPGGVWGNTGTQQRVHISGQPIRGTVFVPAIPGMHTRKFSVTMGTRAFHRPGHSMGDQSPVVTKNKVLNLTARDCGSWPDYSVDMMLMRFFDYLWPIMANTQADDAARQGDVSLAIERYKVAYDRGKTWIHSMAYRALKPAVPLLQKAGRTGEANELIQIIEHDQALDPNTP